MSDARPNKIEESNLTASTELGLLNLSSPEMLIIHSNSLNSTIPASTQFAHPKFASKEQEFEHGFVQVLEDLHKYNHLSVGVNLGAVSSGSSFLSPKNSDLPVYVNFSNCKGELVNTSSPEAASYLHLPSSCEQMQSDFSIHRVHTLKEEAQIVPELVHFGGSPSLSPINMDTQERIKAERKKIRNRTAATKCRKRKLERISCLEEKVNTLKSQNTQLASTASFLREQVAQLKQKVVSHVSSGCQFLSDHETVY